MGKRDGRTRHCDEHQAKVYPSCRNCQKDRGNPCRHQQQEGYCRKNSPETQVGLVEAGDKQHEYRRYGQKPGGLSIRVLQEETKNRQTQKEKNRRRGLQPECRQVVIPPRCFRCLTQQIVLVAGGSGGINPAQSIEVEQRVEGQVVSCTHHEDGHNPCNDKSFQHVYRLGSVTNAV